MNLDQKDRLRILNVVAYNMNQTREERSLQIEKERELIEEEKRRDIYLKQRKRWNKYMSYFFWLATGFITGYSLALHHYTM